MTGSNDRGRLVEDVRRACLEAALAAYEDAGIRGLCAEGRWEHAMEAIRGLDLRAVTEAEAPAKEATDGSRGLGVPGGTALQAAVDPAEPAEPVVTPAAAATASLRRPETAEAPEPAGPRDVTEADLYPILREFYDRLEGDVLLAPYFAELDMSRHLPRIEAFWSTILFRTRRYSDNAFAPHMRMEGLTGDHFARWIATLEAVVDEGFRGPAAERMKDAAHRIAYSMQLRLGIAPFEPYQILKR